MTFTVPSEACQAQFVWTGVQNSFPCGFPALDESDLVVTYSSGAAATLTASIAGAVLTVTEASANVSVGSVLSDTTAALAVGTRIIDEGSGDGGVGSYVVTPSQNVAAEEMTASAATQTLALGVHYTVALDPLSGDATVTPLAMPDDGPGTLIVTRQTSAVQGTQFSDLDSYQADALTALFDQALMAIAELKRRAAVLETAAFGTAPPSINVLSARAQRSVIGNAGLPITGADQIVNFNAAADLAPVIPLAASRDGVALTLNNLPGAHAQTLMRSGADTFNGQAAVVLAAGASITLVPFNDGVNSGWAIE
jgi:hypothetical protein